MERSILSWVCVFALGLVPLVGCSETAGDGGTGGEGGMAGSGGAQVIQAELTFMGVTLWLLQYSETTVLLDAYFSRPGPIDRTGGSTEEGLALMQRVLDAAGVESVDFILVGHSHFDHAIDCGAAAMRTGAQVIGSKTTCLIAQSGGLPEDRCTVVGTGDELPLGEATMRAVRTIHRFPELPLGRFLELDEVPTPEDSWSAPPGGLISYFISFPGNAPFSMFYTDSIGPIEGDDGSGEDYAANLDAAFSDVDGATLWLAPVGFLVEEDLTQYISRIRPDFVIPQHFDGLVPDIEAGLTMPFEPHAALTQVAADEGSTIVVPEEYFDVFVVSPDGVVRGDEAPVQEAFGL